MFRELNFYDIVWINNDLFELLFRSKMLVDDEQENKASDRTIFVGFWYLSSKQNYLQQIGSRFDQKYGNKSGIICVHSSYFAGRSC